MPSVIYHRDYFQKNSWCEVDPIKGRTHSFFLRIWIEYSENIESAPIWRGCIQVVDTKEKEYFSKLDRIEEILRSFLEEREINTD